MGKPNRSRIEPILQTGVLLLVLGVVVGTAALSLRRIFYPYDLDFIEDAMLMQAWRVAQNQPVFLPPNADFVPQVYMPLFTWLGGLLLRLTGPALWPLRLLSWGSTVGTAVLLTTIARKLQSNRVVAVSTGALYLAGFQIVGGWHDLARVDALFGLLVVAGMGTAVYAHHTRRGLVSVGLLLGLSILTKQNGVFISVIVMGWLLLKVGWRVMWAVGVGTAVAVIPSLWLDLQTHGWFTFYVIDIA